MLHHPLPIHTTARSTVSPAILHFTVLRTFRFSLSRVLPTRAVYRTPLGVARTRVPGSVSCTKSTDLQSQVRATKPAPVLRLPWAVEVPEEGAALIRCPQDPSSGMSEPTACAAPDPAAPFCTSLPAPHSALRPAAGSQPKRPTPLRSGFAGRVRSRAWASGSTFTVSPSHPLTVSLAHRSAAIHAMKLAQSSPTSEALKSPLPPPLPSSPSQ